MKPWISSLAAAAATTRMELPAYARAVVFKPVADGV